jgi:hypothetical protein
MRHRLPLVVLVALVGTADAMARERQPTWLAWVSEPELSKHARHREIPLPDGRGSFSTSESVRCDFGPVEKTETPDLGTLFARQLECALPTSPVFAVRVGTGCFLNDGKNEDERECLDLRRTTGCDDKSSNCRGLYICLECRDTDGLSTLRAPS